MNERFAQKNERFAHSLIFGEQPEQIANGRSILVSDFRDLITSLTKNEGMSKLLIF